MCRFYHFIALIMTTLSLTSCDSIPDIDVPEWMGGQTEETGPKIEGERIAVLKQGSEFTPDDSLTTLPIELNAPESYDQWPQHAGSSSGYATTLTLADTLTSEDSTSIGEGANFEYGAVVPPIVAADHVFVMDAEGKISAHLASNINQEVWVSDGVANVDEDDMLGGGLAYHNGTLYAVSGHGLVTAFDPAVGRELWRQNIRIPVRAAPLVAGGKVFVTTADSKLFALDATTGDIIWEDQGLNESASFLANAAPIYHNGLLVIPYASSELKVVTADEGRLLWRDVLALTKRNSAASDFSGIGGSPVVVDNALYAVSTAGVLAAYRLDNGFRVWEQPISSANRPWVSGNVLYVLSTDAELIAINRVDGRIYWVTQLPAYEDEAVRFGPYRWSGPVLADTTLYIVGAHGVMKRVHAETGEILEDLDIPDGILTTPVIAGEKMYLVSQSATLYALY